LAYGEYYRDVVDYLKRNDPDIMQIEQFPHSALIPSIFNSKYNGGLHCKLLTRFHGFTDSSFGNFSLVGKGIQKQCIKASDGIISVSPIVAKNIREQYGVSSHLNPAIGVDTDKFKPMDIDECKEICGLDKNKKYMIYVGRNSRGKNINELIIGAAIVKREYDIDTIVIGDYIKSKYITNFGYVENDILPYYYNSSEFMCYPSFNEGFGIAIAECLACGVPVMLDRDVGLLLWLRCGEQLNNYVNDTIVHYIEQKFIHTPFFGFYKFPFGSCIADDFTSMSFKHHVEEILKNKNENYYWISRFAMNSYMKKMFGVDRVVNDLIQIHKLTMENNTVDKVN